MSNFLVIQSASDAYGTQMNNRATVASLTFLAYDICLTFPDEVAHIWTKPRGSYTKWAFLVLRYFTLANVFAITLVAAGYPGSSVTRFHRQPYCGPWYAYQAIALQVITAIMESIMCLRVYALYGRTRTIATILITLFAAEEISMAAALALFLPHMKLNEQCIADHIPIVSIVFGVAPIAFELVLLAMTWSRVLSMARRTTRREKMLVVLVRDGTWTFLAVFWTFALNGLFYLIITGPMNSMAWTWQFAVSAFAGCRLVLHMHTAGTPHPSLAAAASHQHHRRASSSSHAARHPRGPRARRRTWTTEDDEYSTRYGYGAGDAGINHLDTHFALTTFDPGPEFPMDNEHGEEVNDGVGELGSANPFFSQRMGGQEPWSARSPRPSSSVRPGSSGTGTTGLTGTTVGSSTGAGTAAGTIGRPGSVGRQDRS